MSSPASEFPPINFPTLGYLQVAWEAAHCPIPDGFHKGEPFIEAEWQQWCTLHHGRVRAKTPWIPDNPVKNQAFTFRRSLVVGPQKIGKSPYAAAKSLVMAVGPDLFAGWAEGGEKWDCREHGCGCGFVWEYEPGEPMGMPWPTPLVQLMATSEEQVDNTWRPLKAMVKDGPLAESIRVGESLMRIGDDGSISRVTASALSRLGNPTTGFVQDESGTYTKANGLVGIARTMRRGTTAMGGRGFEFTNAWDPSESSTAQQTFESQAPDLFKFFRQPPPNLSYKNKRERAKIHAFVYAGAAHVDLGSIEAEAFELLEQDPANAERFFGNRLVRGQGSWMPAGLWEGAYAAPKALVA